MICEPARDEQACFGTKLMACGSMVIKFSKMPLHGFVFLLGHFVGLFSILVPSLLLYLYMLHKKRTDTVLCCHFVGSVTRAGPVKAI